MACVLSKSPTLDADYQGTIKEKFTVTAIGKNANGDSIPATISGAAYGGITLTAAPFTFEIAEDVSSLAIIVEGVEINELIQIVEDCPNGLILRQFNMTDPDHTISSVRIKGV